MDKIATGRLLLEASKERLKQAIDGNYQRRRYRTDNAYVQSVSRDALGRSVSATVSVDGVTGYTMKTYGADVGIGERIEVENVSGEPAAPSYQLIGVTPGVPTETRRVAGNSYDGLDLLNLDAIRVRGEGFIQVGGELINNQPAGNRVELRRTGVTGYGAGGNNLTFGLFTGERVIQEGGVEHRFNAGDIHLGLLGSGHLQVDNPRGALLWKVGDKQVFESKMFAGNPITTLRGWLWVGPYDDTGPGISIGREPGDTAFLIRMYNKFGVPLINMAAGTPDDPYEAYVRFGPPKPFPGITIDSDDDGNPRLTVDGGTIQAGTIIASSFLSNSIPGNVLQDLSVTGNQIAYQTLTADKLFVQHLSAITANMGLLNAGEIRVGDGTVGADFTGLRLFNESASLYALVGYDNDVEQARFDTDGTIKWAAGKGTLGADGLSFIYNVHNYISMDASPGTSMLYIRNSSAFSGPASAIWADNNSSASATYAVFGTAEGGRGIYGVSTDSYGGYFESANDIGLAAEAGTDGAQVWYAAGGATQIGLLDGLGGLYLAYGLWRNKGDANSVAYIENMDSAANNVPVSLLTFRHNTSLTPGSDFGSRLLFQLESSTTEDQDAAAFDVLWTTATHASRTAAMRWLLVNNAGALAEYLRLTPSLFTVTPESMFRNHLTLDDDSGASPELKWVAEDGSTVRAWKDNGGDFKFASNAGGIDFSGINGSFSIGSKNFSMGRDLTLAGGHDLHIYLDATSGADGTITMGTGGLDIQTSGGDLSLRPNGNVTIGGSPPSTGKLRVDGIIRTNNSIIANGNSFIGDDANANTTLGLTINQGAADNEILALKSSDVAHGVTSITETDTYGALQKAVADEGGLAVWGYTETKVGLDLIGVATTFDSSASTSALGAITVRARKKSGTSYGALGSNEFAFAVRNSTSTKFLVDAEGDIHYDGSATAYDTYDDVQLVRALDHALAPRDIVRNQFDAWLKYNRADVVAAGILSKHGFVNLTQLTRLHSGAIWQMHTQMMELRQEIAALRERLN